MLEESEGLSEGAFDPHKRAFIRLLQKAAVAKAAACARSAGQPEASRDTSTRSDWDIWQRGGRHPLDGLLEHLASAPDYYYPAEATRRGLNVGSLRSPGSPTGRPHWRPAGVAPVQRYNAQPARVKHSPPSRGSPNAASGAAHKRAKVRTPGEPKTLSPEAQAALRTEEAEQGAQGACCDRG